MLIAELLGVVKQFFPEARVEHVVRDSLMPFRGALSVRKAQVARLRAHASHRSRHGADIEWYLSLVRKVQKGDKKAA